MCIMKITVAKGIVQRLGFGVGERMVIITVINTHCLLHAARRGVEGWKVRGKIAERLLEDIVE